MKKKCVKCGVTKDVSEFGKSKSSKDGLEYRCKICERIRNKNREHTPGRRFSNYKQRAKDAELKFSLTKESFIDITSKPCVYCGGFSDSSVEKFCGIDRINSRKGYIKGNIVPCCNVCNIMKGSLLYKDFLSQIRKIFYNLQDKERE